MSKKANLLATVRAGRNKNLFFSLTTALKIVQGKEDTDEVFVVSFGSKKPKLHNSIFHKHIYTKRNVNYQQPFKLDSLLVSSYDGTVIDGVNTLRDINNGVIGTVYNPYTVISRNPSLIIRAASIKAETNFNLDTKLKLSMTKQAHKLRSVNGLSIWREFRRLLRAETPSKGIECLREIGALDIILPELSKCYRVEQNAKYHKYSVYEHCIFACDACVKQDPRVRFAALIHDIGKPDTKGKNINGTTFHKHEVVSAKLARNIVKRFNIKNVDANYIVSLVANHMYHYDSKWKSSTVIKFISKVGLTPKYIGRMDKFPLFQIRHADRAGRGLEPITKKQLDFEYRLEKIIRENFSK